MKVDAHYQQVLRHETELHFLQPKKAVHEQACSSHQYKA